MTKDELRELQLAQLKKMAKVFLAPQDALPFSVVVEAMTDQAVLPMTQSPRDSAMLQALANACVETTAESARRAFVANRPNDVSAQVEKRLQTQLEAEGFSVEMPRAATGRTSGY